MHSFTYGALALIIIVAAACGDDSAAGSGGAGGGASVSGAGGMAGAGGMGGAPMVDPGPTCTAFCAHVVGACEAFTTTEEACRQGCEMAINDEYASSEACGEAVMAWFECVAALDCQGVYDARDRVPPGEYPCEPAVAEISEQCPAPN